MLQPTTNCFLHYLDENFKITEKSKELKKKKRGEKRGEIAVRRRKKVIEGKGKN